jgi:hypothetical protein
MPPFLSGEMTAVAIAREANVPVLGAPVRGGPWVCANGLASNNAHASTYMSGTARLRVPQLYGCDFSALDAAGNRLPSPFPDEISNQMFYGYGAEVLAVADAEVVFVRDGIPDNVPLVSGEVRMSVPLTNATVAGNIVTLKIASRHFAFYAHLQPGSIRVRQGQRVKKGAGAGSALELRELSGSSSALPCRRREQRRQPERHDRGAVRLRALPLARSGRCREQ